MYVGLHVKYPLSCPILMKLEYSRDSIEKSSNIKFNKNSCPVGAELFHADRRTDMMKLIDTFRTFKTAPKIVHRGKSGTVRLRRVSCGWLFSNQET